MLDVNVIYFLESFWVAYFTSNHMSSKGTILCCIVSLETMRGYLYHKLGSYSRAKNIKLQSVT